MDADDLTDEEITKKLEKMVSEDKEDEFFSKWPPLKRRLFYKSTIPTLSKPILVTDLGVGSIMVINLFTLVLNHQYTIYHPGPLPSWFLTHLSLIFQNSTIFDASSENTDELQANYRRAIGHYRAWHLAGSDGVYEFGWDSRERFCVSRKDQTFIFWFRIGSRDVGLIIDGQRLWVEGFIRRTFNADGTFTYNNHLIQFRDETRKKPATGSEAERAYIQGSDVQVVNCGGSYEKSVTERKFDAHLLRGSIGVISSYERDNKFETTCHETCDILVLFGSEAGKNSWISQFTMESLDSTIIKPIQIPICLHATVVKHKKTTLSELAAVKKRMEKSSANNEEYSIVVGAPFRRLCQCVDAFFIFAREVTFDTKFLVPETPRDSRPPAKPKQMKGKHSGTRPLKKH